MKLACTQSTASSGVEPADTESSFLTSFYGLEQCVAPVRGSLLAWSRSILSRLEKLFPSIASCQQEHRALNAQEGPDTGRRSCMTLQAVLLSANSSFQHHVALLRLHGERLGTSLCMLVCQAVVPQSLLFGIAQATQ